MAKIDRRDFVKLVGAGGIGAGAGFMIAESTKHPVEFLVPYVVPPEDFSAGIATWYNTACTLCGAGCGISVRTREGRAKKIEGNPAHPVNQGRLCALGQAGLQVLYNPDRLTGPLVRTGDRFSGPFQKTTWEQGLTQLSGRLQTLRDARKGERIAFLSETLRGHLGNLIELFMDELGSKRILQHDFADPKTLYAANQKFFDVSTLPYYDISNTNYLLSFGADYLGEWLSPVHYSLGFGHSRQGRPNARGRFVQIEPRMSVSGAAADEWIAARPGTEGVLALGLAHHIVSSGRYRGGDRSTWSRTLEPYAPGAIAEQTGVPAEMITRLAEAFADTAPSLAIGGGATANHTNGVDALVAVNALNYLVGNLGKEGGVVFNPDPLIGQGLRPRQASYDQMLDFIDDARAGRIDVLIINGTNPVFTLPAASGFREAMASIPLIVSLSSFMDDTTAMADLILPSHTYLESWGDSIPEPGVGFRVGTIAQPVVSPLYNTKATGDIILGIARELDLGEPMPWASMEDLLKQGWRRIYSRSAAPDNAESFESFWNTVLKAGVWGEQTLRKRRSYAPSRQTIKNIGVEPPEFAGAADDYPFILHPYLSTTLRDGRGANLPWLQELPDPMTAVVYGTWVEINPVTATELGVKDGDLVEVMSPYGGVTAPVLVYPAIRPDVIAMPIGQGHTHYGRYASNRGANPIAILAPQTEPSTGSLAWSATRIRLVPTGRHVQLVRSGGKSRELGRDIIQTTKSSDGEHDRGQHSANLHSIPIEVEPT